MIRALVALLLAADPAMEPPRVIVRPGLEYSDAYRRFQGIPCIERARNGRLWAVWYSGDIREGPNNYVVLATSGDDGRNWSGPNTVIDPEGFVRAFDACVWMDPLDRLWVFWGQAAGHWDGRAGIWAMMAPDPGSAKPKWSAPRRIADGVLMNKPIVRSNGDWLFPVTLWTREPTLPLINERDRLNLTPEALRGLLHDPATPRGSHALISRDHGKTFQRLAVAPFPAEDGPTENMLIERRDRSLWMLARTRYGIGESESRDGGESWSAAKPSAIAHPPTRFFVTRLRSGKLLLVKHVPPNGKDRSHLTALLSDDEGRTWAGGLLLDERMNVSYPDGVQGPDGRIYIIYDRERFSEREILVSVFREQDVLSGVGAERRLVSKAGATERPPLAGSGWRQLQLEDWTGREDRPHKWYSASDVFIKPLRPRDLLLPVGPAGRGPVMANGDDGRTQDLVSRDRFGDFELYLEFLLTAKSNSGLYLHGLYEVQMLDSYGSTAPPGVHDSGALYERWIDNKGVGGTAPLRHASRPPGEWQSFHVWFRAPRFNAAGAKTEPARVVRLDYNGVTVQRDVELPGPTRASLDIAEAAVNPLMIQGDHGPVAIRNVFIRKAGAK